MKKTKEQIEEEKRIKRELKDKNSAKIKKIWRTNTRDIFPENFDQIDDLKMSTKFILIDNMLREMWKILEEKVVLVSNYCETLDILEDLCKKKKYPFIRFDGKTNIGIR